MFTTKLRIAALPVLTIILLAAGGILIPWDAQGDAAPAPAPPKVPKELLENRLDAAKRVWVQTWQRIRSGHEQPRALFGWSERWLEAELALLDKKEDRVKALADHVQRTRDVERAAITQAKRGIGMQADADAATYERSNAEIRYFQAAGKVPPAPPEVKDSLPKNKEKARPLPPPKDDGKP